MKHVIVIVSAILVAACATAVPRDENSPYFVVPTGSSLVLNSDVEIPANSARVFLQGGKALSRNEINLYYPHCWLEVRKVLDVPQRVRTDTFTIYKVNQGMDFHTAALGGLRLASRDPLTVATIDSGGGPIMFVTELYLRSTAQPDVMRITCRQLEEPGNRMRHVTIREMRQVLGELATLQLASGA